MQDLTYCSSVLRQNWRGYTIIIKEFEHVKLFTGRAFYLDCANHWGSGPWGVMTKEEARSKIETKLRAHIDSELIKEGYILH